MTDLPDGVTTLADALRPILDELRAIREIQEANGGSRWLTCSQASNYLRMSEKSLRSLVSERRIPVARPLRGSLLFDREALDAYCEGTADLPVKKHRRGVYDRDALRIAQEGVQEATG